MRDLEKMLEGLSEDKNHMDKIQIKKGENDLTELEVKRIYNRTMEKIEEERGKEKTEEQSGKHGSFFKKYSKIVAAAAIAGTVCLAGATAVASLRLDQSIKNFFFINDKAEEKKAEKLLSEVNKKSKNNGIEISVSQVLSDTSRCYAVLKAKDIPDDISGQMTFEETEVTVKDKKGKEYFCTVQEPEMGPVNENTTTFGLLISGVNDNGDDVDITGKQMKLTLKNIGYKENGEFVPMIKGNWTLDWTVKNAAEKDTISVNKKIPLLNSKAFWKDIVISPLSLTVHYYVTEQGSTHMSEAEYEKCEDTERLTIQFLDGTRIDSRFADDVNMAWGTKEELGFKSIGFEKIVDTSQIESITFGKKTIVINENKNTVKRFPVIGKAANCKVMLPKEVSSILSTEEVYEAKNQDFNCKEKYTIFWAKKNGAKMPFFTIHRLKGTFTEADLEEHGDMMTYIGYHEGYTYTVEYGEIVEEAQAKEFVDLLNNYISNLLPYLEYVK